MSTKWRGLHGPITADTADAEPEAQRLFSRPQRPISKDLARLFARVGGERSERQSSNVDTSGGAEWRVQ